MIVHLLLVALNVAVTAFTFWLPVVTKLPFSIDTLLSDGIGYILFLNTLFPPFGVALQGVLWIIGFKIALKVVAMIPIVRGLLHK